jgi:cysteine desulfurase
MVVLGAALRKSSHIVTTAIEHPALLEAAKEAGARGAEVTIVSVDKTGAASFEQLKNGINSRTALVTLMYANNETGALQPVSEIGDHLRKIGSSAILHSDAVQALGKSDFSFSRLKLDLASISAHKIGGLPGVGALIAKAGLELTPLLFGGPQEKRARAGTENVLGIVSFGAAARILNRQRDDRIQRLRTNREIIWSVLRDSLENIKPTVDLSRTLPNTLSLFIKDIDSADLVVGLDLEGVEISSGAACASGKPGASHVLTGMGYSEQEARSIIRISVGAEDDSSRMESAAKTIVRVVQRMRHGK